MRFLLAQEGHVLPGEESTKVMEEGGNARVGSIAGRTTDCRALR
jgi:hypothetical protein